MVLNKIIVIFLFLFFIFFISANKENFSKHNIHINFNFDKNSFSSNHESCILDKIIGKYTNDRINSISFLSNNNILYSSGNSRNGKDFILKCPNNKCITSYKYNDIGHGNNSSLFAGVGDIQCGNEQYTEKYGNINFNNKWDIKNNISQSDCKKCSDGQKTLDLSEYKYKVFYYGIDTNNKFRENPYKSEYITNSSINFNWKNNVLNSGKTDMIGLKFFGYILPRLTGKYIFKIESNDGAYLNINKINYIDNLVVGKMNKQTTEILLTKNVVVSFEIKYVNYDSNGYLKLYWKTPESNNWEIIPKNNIFY